MGERTTAGDRFEAIARQSGTLIIVFRAAFLIMLSVIAGLAILRDSVTDTGGLGFYSYWWVIVLGVAAFAGSIIVMDILTPRRKLTTLSAIMFGVFAGLLVTLLLSWVIDLFVETYQLTQTNPEERQRLILAVKVMLGIGMCYLGITTVLQTQDDFRLVIPYVEFSKQYRGMRPFVLDASALIDGRILDVAPTGVIQSQVIVPQFVVGELQRLSDSAERMKRNRGRRGLELLARLQRSPHVDVVVEETSELTGSVDQGVIDFARELSATIVTTDFGLAQAASVHSVPVLNLNDLANALKPNLLAGETVSVHLVKRGEHPGQGVGYLDDGTMVVVEHGEHHIDETVDLVVTGTVQTSAGRLVFARVHGESDGSMPPRKPMATESGEQDPEPEPISANDPARVDTTMKTDGASTPQPGTPGFRDRSVPSTARRSDRNPRRG